MINRFLKFDFKFRVLLNPKVNKHMRMRSHNMKKVITAYAQFATLCRYDRFHNLRSGKL